MMPKIDGIIDALTLLRDKYNKKWGVGAVEHDELYLEVLTSEIPEDSEDGKFLVECGFHTYDDMWRRFI